MHNTAKSLLPLALLLAGNLYAQPPAPSPCVEDQEVICGQLAPEDMVALGSNWVAASAYSGGGGVALVSTRDHSTRIVYPAANAQNRHDSTTYPDCPAPPPAGFQTHGLYVEPGSGPLFKLFAVAHGPRESIEIFEIDTSGDEPKASWLGCAVAPDPIGLNSVRGLADGGFFTTNFQNRGEAPSAMRDIMNGKVNGEIWEWHTASGWQKVPGSESSGPNGIEVSDDGKSLFIASWGGKNFSRLSLGVTPPHREEVPLGFLIDNIHWASDGQLWGAGQDGQGWKVVKINPQTLKVTDIAQYANDSGFGSGTTVTEVGTSLWIGSFRGDRIRIVSAP